MAPHVLPANVWPAFCTGRMPGKTINFYKLVEFRHVSGAINLTHFHFGRSLSAVRPVQFVANYKAPLMLS